MGLFLFDYFRCEPFEINFRILVVNGFWSLKTDNKFWKMAFSVYGFLCNFSIVSMMFIQIVDVYLLRNDPLNLTKNLCATSVTVGCVTKYMTIFYKADLIEDLHSHLNRLLKRKTDPEDIKLVKKADNAILRVTKAFYGMAVPCVIIWMIFPGLEGRDQHKLPFPYRLPVDDWSTPVYEIVYVYQSMSMIGFMVNILSTDLVFYGMVIRVNTQYDMVIRQTELLGEILRGNPKGNDRHENEEGQANRYDPETTERLRIHLRRIVDFHHDIIRQVDCLKEIYSGGLFLHLITAVTMVGVIIIDILMISKGFRLQMVQRIMYTANGLFDTFLICLFTSMMEEKSIKLFRAIYSMPWYRINPRLRQDLMIIAMRCQKPPALKLGHTYPLNLSMFLQFLKITYNTTALLYQTVRK